MTFTRWFVRLIALEWLTFPKEVCLFWLPGAQEYNKSLWACVFSKCGLLSVLIEYVPYLYPLNNGNVVFFFIVSKSFYTCTHVHTSQMARHAWQGYVDYAWGENELKPISKRGHSASIFGKNTRLGATIVDSLDTLYMMGLMDQFNQGKEWVRNSLNLDQVCPTAVTNSFVAHSINIVSCQEDVLW